MEHRMPNGLWGDGVHDDTAGIQALLDSGAGGVYLPVPSKYYLISDSLRIHSNTQLRLDRYTTVKLAPQSNCHMVINGEEDASHITITGGIWDFNNKNQAPNPLYETPDGDVELFHIFYFDRVKHLHLSDLTLKDPVTFSTTFSYIEYFTVSNITFDFNYGNPIAMNMDGIHLNGGCRFGRITNLQGACYDDLVALNADEGRGGPIEDIEIDGIFCSDCHSAVRLLSRGQRVRRIHISNVFGTFYQYCVGISRHLAIGQTGQYDQIQISDIYASKAERISIYGKDGMYVFPLIWIEGGLEIRNLQISQLHRREEITAVPSIAVLKGTRIKLFSIEHFSQENHTGIPFPALLNEGVIDQLILRDIQVAGDVLLENNGTIQKMISDESVFVD